MPIHRALKGFRAERGPWTASPKVSRPKRRALSPRHGMWLLARPKEDWTSSAAPIGGPEVPARASTDGQATRFCSHSTCSKPAKKIMYALVAQNPR